MSTLGNGMYQGPTRLTKEQRRMGETVEFTKRRAVNRAKAKAARAARKRNR
jgi:hypothetical protein